MSKWNATPYELATYKGRQIDESSSPGYCGGFSVEVHCSQLSDPTSWVHSRVKQWELLGGWPTPALHVAAPVEPTQRELAVWCGPMPESNGKSNFTALLYWKGTSFLKSPLITLARTEYPDRARYEADRVRHLIGEWVEEPCVLDYDTNKHSGYAAPVEPPQHPDDIAVDTFAVAMKDKLAKARDKGRYGWQNCTQAHLSALLYRHVYKADPLDVANIAMMLHQNGQVIELPHEARRPPAEPALVSKCTCTLAIRALGDGCRHCQPQEYIDHLHGIIEELQAEPTPDVVVGALVSDEGPLLDTAQVIMDQQSHRITFLEDLLQSAHCIAARNGANTAWARFAESVKAAGIGGVTARSYKVLEGDEPTPVQAPAGMVLVDRKALGTVLQALVSAPHYIRELQATREPVELFGGNPINVLITSYGASAAPTEGNGDE